MRMEWDRIESGVGLILGGIKIGVELGTEWDWEQVTYLRVDRIRGGIGIGLAFWDRG